MSDIQNGQITAEGQTAEPMPSSEQPAEDAKEAVVEETPEQIKARTAEQFEKLTAKNRELSEKLKAFEGSKPSYSSVLDELHPNVDAVPQVPAPLPGESMFDEGGFIDANLLNSTLSASQKNAEEARRIALQTQQEIQRFQESQVVQAVHKDYPEIDPNNQDEFNPEIYDFVKNELVGQLMKGQKQDLSAAAAKARKYLGKQFTPVEPRKETISQRDQASAPTSTSHSAPQALDQSDLVARTYKGDKDAIYKRLQASGN